MGNVSYHIFSSRHASGPSVAQRGPNQDWTCFAYALFWGTASDVKTARLSYILCLNFTECQLGSVAVWNGKHSVQKGYKYPVGLLQVSIWFLVFFLSRSHSCEFSPRQPQFIAYKLTYSTTRPLDIRSSLRFVKIGLKSSMSALFSTNASLQYRMLSVVQQSFFVSQVKASK